MKTKNDKSMLLLSSVICLLPVILSIAVYNKLPEQVAIHWNNAGEPDNFAHKAFAAFGIPIFLMCINIFVRIRLYNDPKRANASKVMRGISAWLVPLASLIFVPITLYIAMGVAIPISMIVPVFVGFIMILFGNYLPKSRQNYSMGIRLPWTLSDSDNWNKTQRLAGVLWILGGIFLVVSSFIFNESTTATVVTIGIVVLLIIIPFFYSFWVYKTSER